MKTALFYHCYTVNDYQSITNEFLSYAGKPIDECDDFYVCVSGDGDVEGLPPKARVQRHFINDFEFGTLNVIRQYCAENDAKVLYCHSKGVTTPGNECISDWRKYMFYFLLSQHQECTMLLDSYDTVGVDLVDTPVLHYSGNCWWSKSSYINKLVDISAVHSPLSERHKCEFWLTSGVGRHCCLHQSGINVYERHLHRYSKDNYEAV